MTYSEYYKIIHRRNPYNVKFLADFLTLYFPLSAIEFDADIGVFSLDRDFLITMDFSDLNRLSKVISKHGYYDAFDNFKFLIIPHVWKK